MTSPSPDGLRRYSHLSTTEAEQLFLSNSSNLLQEKEKIHKAQHRHHVFALIRQWWWEVLGLAVCIICMSLIAAILLSMDNKLQSHWKLPIQPNSLVAVFSTIARSGLLVCLTECISQLKWLYFRRPRPLSQLQVFDDASRGPWGSLMFLWKTKMTAVLGAIGAALMIMSLLFDPFMQQIIGVRLDSALYYTNPLSDKGNGTNWVTQATALSDSALDANFGVTQFGRTKKADLGLMVSMFLSDVENGARLGVSCSSTDCIFPPFTTLGVCASCTPYPVSIDQNMDCKFAYQSPDEVKYNVSFATGWSNRADYMAAIKPMDIGSEKDVPTINGTRLTNKAIMTSCTPNFPWEEDGDLTVYGDVCFAQTQEDYVTLGSIDVPETIEDTLDISLFNEKWEALNVASPRIITFGGWNLTSNETSTRSIDQCGNIQAVYNRCTLDFCAIHYGKTYFHDGNWSVPTEPVSETFLPLHVDSDMHDPTAAPNDWIARVNDTSLAPENQTTFNIGNASRKEMFMYLRDHFQTWMEEAIAVDDRKNPVRQEDLANNIARGVSHFLRIVNNNQTKVFGEVYGPTTFIYVRWRWFILPVAIVVLTMVFFVLTVIRNGQERHMYKSSILALLFHGLEGWKAEELDTARWQEWETEHVLMRQGQRMRAVLALNEEGVVKFLKSD